ncbi:MAG: replicative DNA helicase [Leptospiraceae bacterium]|nr:replicative DNA helicase [Leptospiraceae bacterium]
MDQEGLHLPHDPQTEREFLGALLLRPELITSIADTVRVEDLYLQAHRLLFKALLHLERAEGSVGLDSVRVIQYLQDVHQLEDCGGAGYIQDLAANVITPHNAPRHAQRLHSLAIRRQLIEAAEQIKLDAAIPGEDEGSFLRQVEELILKITGSDVQHGITPIAEIKEEFKDYLRNLIEAQGRIQGTVTGFEGFDRLTAGLKAGQLIILAARPGIGKTTLAMNMAAHVARQNETALIFSLEMSNLELMMRLVCSEALINNSNLQMGNIQPAENENLIRTINTIASWPLFIDDSGDLTIWDCISRCRKFHSDQSSRNKKLGLIVIDYLQLMTDPEARKLGRQQEVASISRSLKQLAKAVNVPILALSQMNRSVEQRRGDYSRPQLSDLRESGAIEQDADIVMFLHKEIKKEDENDFVPAANNNIIELIVAKHRSGATKNFELLFEPKYNLFRDAGDMQQDEFSGGSGNVAAPGGIHFVNQNSYN